MNRHNRRRAAGFTLVELMVTVAIVAILASIAFPSYRAQVRRSHRTDAKVALLNSAQGLERCFTRFNSYMDEDAAGNALCEMTFPFTVEEGTYAVSIVRDAETFTLTATPQGAQVDDTACANFTLTQTGARGISGTGATVQDCWGK